MQYHNLYFNRRMKPKCPKAQGTFYILFILNYACHILFVISRVPLIAPNGGYI